MKTCKICGCSFDEENFEGVVVNEGIDNEYHVCCDCVPSECNNGHIISCEACGSYFSADKLHDEDVDVYDLDVSDFPDEGEQEAADQKEAELDELVKSPGWRAVW